MNISLGEMAIKLVVLFYASEFILMAKPRYWDALRTGALASLLVIGMRGII